MFVNLSRSPGPLKREYLPSQVEKPDDAVFRTATSALRTAENHSRSSPTEIFFFFLNKMMLCLLVASKSIPCFVLKQQVLPHSVHIMYCRVDYIL